MGMNTYLKHILKPVFRAIASPGLGNPHDESPLMAAGAKPTAIMADNQISAQMKTQIENGHIIKIAEKSNTLTHRIYCHPSAHEDAQRAAHIAKNMFMGNANLNTPEDNLFFNSFFFQNIEPNTQETTYIEDRPQCFGHEFELAVLDNNKTPTMQKMLNGEINAVLPINFNHGNLRDSDFEDAVNNKSICAVDFSYSSSMSVYAQADRIEEGKELFARYFSNGQHDYEPLSGDERNKRIGELLGFTENDIAWHLATKYQNPVILSLMNKTENIRRWARHECMMMDAENKTVTSHIGLD